MTPIDRPVPSAALAAPDRPPGVVMGGLASVAITFAILWVVVPYGMFPQDDEQYAAPWPEQVGGPLIRHMRQRTQVGKFIVYYDRAD